MPGMPGCRINDEPSNGRYLTHVGGSYSFRHIGGLTAGATYNQNVAYSTLNGQAEFSIGRGSAAKAQSVLAPRQILMNGTKSMVNF